MESLRWILLIAGLVLIGAIYWSGRRRERARNEGLVERARRTSDAGPEGESRVEPDLDLSGFDPDLDEDPAPGSGTETPTPRREAPDLTSLDAEPDTGPRRSASAEAEPFPRSPGGQRRETDGIGRAGAAPDSSGHHAREHELSDPDVSGVDVAGGDASGGDASGPGPQEPGDRMQTAPTPEPPAAEPPPARAAGRPRPQADTPEAPKPGPVAWPEPEPDLDPDPPPATAADTQRGSDGPAQSEPERPSSDASSGAKSAGPSAAGSGAPDRRPDSRVEKSDLQRVDADRVIVLYVVAARGQRLVGSQLRAALERQDLRHRESGVFEIRDGDGDTVFSVANVVEPGTFDLATMDTLTTPGVALFMQASGPRSAETAFDRMLDTARALTEEFGGRLLDAQPSPLTRQTEQHMREELRELDRRRRARPQ